MIPIAYRANVANDFPFVYQTFVEGAKTYTYSLMVGKIYYRRYKPIVKNILLRSKVLVACLPDDPNTIVGYIIYEYLDNIPIIHWVHTRKMFQKQGIAKELCKLINKDFGDTLTMSSHVCKDFYELRKKFNLGFDPFLIYGV